MDKLKELKEKPKEELLKYSAKELRHAASVIDRNNKKHNILNAISIFKKLKELDAELHILPDESGYITFPYEDREIYRDFKSGSELSLALALGPIDLYGSELYYKRGSKTHECEINSTDTDKESNSKNNIIIVYVKELDLHSMIHLNGAEKVLCNTKDGLTLGQLILKEKLNKDT